MLQTSPCHDKVFLLPSGYVKIAIENGPVEIVDNYPAIKWWIFPSFFVNVYQRVQYNQKITMERKKHEIFMGLHGESVISRMENPVT